MDKLADEEMTDASTELNNDTMEAVDSVEGSTAGVRNSEKIKTNNEEPPTTISRKTSKKKRLLKKVLAGLLSLAALGGAALYYSRHNKAPTVVPQKKEGLDKPKEPEIHFMRKLHYDKVKLEE